MSRAPVPLQSAYVLRTAPYRDSSLLVEAFTRQQGRIGLVARGARAAKSKQRVLLQTFQPLLLSWSAVGELGTLVGVEAEGPAIALNGEQVFSGWYLNELLLRLLHRDDPHPELFGIYDQALRSLPEEGARSLRRFELRLLAELGFGLALPDDLDPKLAYRYDRGCEPQAAAVDEPGAVSGRCLIALRDDGPMAPAELREARDLLRALVEPQLGGKPLASAAMLRTLRERRHA